MVGRPRGMIKRRNDGRQSHDVGPSRRNQHRNRATAGISDQFDLFRAKCRSIMVDGSICRFDYFLCVPMGRPKARMACAAIEVSGILARASDIDEQWRGVANSEFQPNWISWSRISWR